MSPLDCPKCKADLRENWREENGQVTEGSRVIGIVENDRVVRWRCPACGHEWQRPAVTGSRGPLGADARPELNDDGAKN